ncbi:MAG: GNAT family N-acetyltransferase, partial [Spirochaetales bacterium]|nr:GNAT family N-acetyltransferase [Spirochaetales bacterium]
MVIRHAKPDDLERLAQIEALSYPEQEGASKESIWHRILAFPDCFWILEDNVGNITSFINGLITDCTDLTDEMYDNPQMHDPEGKWQMIFSVVTATEYRHKGCASALLRQMISDSKAR